MKTSTLALLFGCLTASLFGVSTSDIELEPENNNIVSTSVSLGTVFRYKANVKRLHKNCIESSSVSLSDLEWKVKLCKVGDSNSNHNLAVYLSSASHNTLKYACEAKATFKLLPKPGQSAQSLRQIMPKHRHTDSNPTFAIEKFTTWSTFETYLHENEATFEIELSTIRLHSEEPTDTQPITSRINVRLENVSQLTQTYSPVVVARGIEWRANIKRAGEFLSVYLEANEKHVNTGYFYKVEATSRLLPINSSLRPLTHEFKHDYRFGSSNQGIEKFVTWNDLMNKYVSKDKASLLIQFKVESPQSLWDIDSNDLS